jgi:hypothetical protein
VGPRAGLDTETIGKNAFASAGDRTSIAQSSSPLPDTILTELTGSHTPDICDSNFSQYTVIATKIFRRFFFSFSKQLP